MDQQQLPRDNQEEAIRKRVRIARFLWGCLLVGQIGAVAYYYFVPQLFPHFVPTMVYVLIDVGVLWVLVPAPFVIRRFIFRNGRVNGVLSAIACQRGNIIFWAGCMGVVIFSGQIASMSGTWWPFILILAVAVVMQVVTIPTVRQVRCAAGEAGMERKRWPMMVAAGGLAIVSAYCVWLATKGPPEWARHAPPEAVATQPSQFIPEDQWRPAYLEKLRTVVGEQKGVEFKIYGMQRGVARQDGWVKVISTGAGFSMVMPGPSLDMRLSTNATDGVAVVIDTLECDANGLKFRATCTRRADGKLTDQAEHLVETFRAHPEKATVREIKVGSEKVYDIRSTSKIGIMRIRTCTCRGAIWMWATEYPAADETTRAAEVDGFLDSFEFPVKR